MMLGIALNVPMTVIGSIMIETKMIRSSGWALERNRQSLVDNGLRG